MERDRITGRPGSEGRLVQIERDLVKISDLEPESDVAVVRCRHAWADLNTERPVGMVVGLIPFRAIVAWCDVYRLDLEATKIMIYVIRTLDADQAEARAAKARQETALGTGRGRKGARR